MSDDDCCASELPDEITVTISDAPDNLPCCAHRNLRFKREPKIESFAAVQKNMPSHGSASIDFPPLHLDYDYSGRSVYKIVIGRRQFEIYFHGNEPRIREVPA